MPTPSKKEKSMNKMFQRTRATKVFLYGMLAVIVSISTGFLFASNGLAATPGWDGEHIISVVSSGNGWEPAIAADPSAPYVYAGWMQYEGNKILIKIATSSDGGSTFGAAQSVCPACGTGTGQYDIVLATSTNGTLFATYMQSNKISFAKSSDHATTWTPAITVSGASWSDKPWMGVSPSGNDIYIAWATRGNVYTVASHNGGASFSAPLQVTSESYIYYYPNGATVLNNGTAVFVASEYPEKGNSTKQTGAVPIVAFRTSNGGTSWTRTVVDTLNTGATYATSSVTTVTSDGTNLLLVYSGSLTVGANGKVYVRRSTDSGVTWSARTEMTTSAGGADATSVAAAGKPGLFAITWMDNRGGAWNVWERESTDGGLTWSADTKVSDAVSGAAYKTATGFGMPYGDYDMLALNSLGKPVAVMGEGDSTQTNGDIWVNRKQ
jgi:hypothetical protein